MRERKRRRKMRGRGKERKEEEERKEKRKSYDRKVTSLFLLTSLSPPPFPPLPPYLASFLPIFSLPPPDSEFNY